MDFGFFIRLRALLRVDQVLIRCQETRYYHVFGTEQLLREIRHYQDDYQACLGRSPDLHRKEMDELVADLPIVGSRTESLKLLF